MTRPIEAWTNLRRDVRKPISKKQNAGGGGSIRRDKYPEGISEHERTLTLGPESFSTNQRLKTPFFRRAPIANLFCTIFRNNDHASFASFCYFVLALEWYAEQAENCHNALFITIGEGFSVDDRERAREDSNFKPSDP